MSAFTAAAAGVVDFASVAFGLVVVFGLAAAFGLVTAFGFGVAFGLAGVTSDVGRALSKAP